MTTASGALATRVWFFVQWGSDERQPWRFTARFEKYEEAQAFIETTDVPGIYSIEKRWVKE